MSAPDDRAGRRISPATVRDVAIITGMLVAISVLHYFTDPALYAPHLLYRRLYYVPILYAAWVFGARGGIGTGVAASVLFGIHAEVSLGGFLGPNIDNLLEIIMYILAGGLFGWLRDTETRRTAELREVGARLEEAYGKLEERAVQLINIQEYTQAILRSITSGVITVGPDGSVATANPAAERIAGVPEAEMVPRTFSALFPSDDGLSADVRKVLDGRASRSVAEVKLTRADGEVVHAQAAVSRMRDVDGRILGAVVTLEDLSELKALTQQLIRADRLAAMGELTAGVAHEVRNPLGIIRASVQLMDDANCDTERMREASRVIKHEIDRLDNVIKALLDFGRPSAPNLVPTDVEEVLTDVVLFTKRFAGRAHVRIDERYAPDLPPVLADPNQLKQVFVNLISNAVQAMETTGGTIELSTALAGGQVQLKIADTGPGMPADVLDKVFDPFFSTRDAGTGLGLTITHRIIDDHDGRIEVASEPGKGTTFTILLPVAAAGARPRPVAEGRD